MRDKQYYCKQMKLILEKSPFLSNTDVAYQLILSDILDGRLQPLDKIPQDSLAELFEMSRTPVRDALSRLEKEDFIVKTGKSGYQVHKVTFKEYLEFCDFRMLIEAHAAALAANAMSEAEMAELGKVVQEYNKACNNKDIDIVFALDERIHELIVKGSHNKYLYKAYQDYLPKKKFYFTLNIKDQRNLTRMKNKHNRIYQAIQQNDEELAYRQMRNHLEVFFNFYN